jgi:bacterioferritin (cytochrome b1)
MHADERMVRLFSYYRDAEIRGAGLLFKLLGRMSDDPDSQVKLSHHLADETRHASLWTKRITQLGAMPVPVEDGYQTRIGRALGIPKTLIDLLALTVVVERRAQTRYEAHGRWPDVDPATREMLVEVTQDEKWHLSWIEKKMYEIAGPEAEKARARLEEYGRLEARVVDELQAMEKEAFGFSFADLP